MARKILGSLLAALQTAAIVLFMGSAAPVGAESLNTYYKTLIAVRKCELSVDDAQLARLQEIIENRVTDTDASSDAINAIFDQIAAEIGSDTPAFCAAYSETALSLLATF
ncbi:MAG: hypothetical protein AB7F09_25770 [Parvibaculaceae bacterium]